jgi:hypothetical protein
MTNRAAFALECVVRNIEPESQWTRAVEAMRKMSEFEKAAVWLELSNTAKETGTEAEKMIALSQYKLVFKRAIRDVENIPVMLIETGNNSNVCCDEIKRRLDRISVVLKAMLQRIHNHEIHVDTESESEDVERFMADSPSGQNTGIIPMRGQMENMKHETERLDADMRRMREVKEKSDMETQERIDELFRIIEKNTESREKESKKMAEDIKKMETSQEQKESEMQKRVEEMSSAQDKNFNAYTRLFEQTIAVIKDIEATQKDLNDLIAKNHAFMSEIKAEIVGLKQEVKNTKEETKNVEHSITELIPALTQLVFTHKETAETQTEPPIGTSTTNPTSEASTQNEPISTAEMSTQSEQGVDTQTADEKHNPVDSTPETSDDSGSSSGRSAGNSDMPDSKKANNEGKTKAAKGNGGKKRKVKAINARKDNTSPSRKEWDPSTAKPGQPFVGRPLPPDPLHPTEHKTSHK